MVQHMKKEKYSFKRGIIALHFGEKKQVPLYPFQRKHGELVVQVSVTIIRQMAAAERTHSCYGE